ncbi:hypothetical protein AX17_001832 [Amanita inopinata Kibby_2008]|nr:hypothetical protein AX17_001832 [Amanita inopinata Kibby_2008]
MEVLTPLFNPLLTHLRNLLLHILSTGPIPSHIAFVMDGNRRYARSHHQHVQQGHKAGFEALRGVLEVCLRLGVKCVSAYAFSIENFNRDEEEVRALMELAEEKLLEICRHGEVLDEYGVRLNVVGKIGLLPESVQRAVEKAESMTRHNNRAVLNLCMPYTSRDEIATAVESCVQDALQSSSLPTPSPSPKSLSLDSAFDSSLDGDTDNAITEQDITSHLMLTRAGSPPLDILVSSDGPTTT